MASTTSANRRPEAKKQTDSWKLIKGGEIDRKARLSMKTACAHNGSFPGGGVMCSHQNITKSLQYSRTLSHPVRIRARDLPCSLMLMFSHAHVVGGELWRHAVHNFDSAPCPKIGLILHFQPLMDAVSLHYVSFEKFSFDILVLVRKTNSSSKDGNFFSLTQLQTNLASSFSSFLISDGTR